MKLYKAALIVLLACISNCYCSDASIVKVVEFLDKPAAVDQNDQFDEDINTDIVLVANITICFRLMLRYGHGLNLIKTKQIGFKITSSQLNVGFLSYRALNTKGEEDLGVHHSRLIHLCKDYGPGKWISLCLRLKNSLKSQELTVVQDGKICVNKTYQDGEFGPMQFRSSPRFHDM